MAREETTFEEFKKGLEVYNLTPEEFKKNYFYCGKENFMQYDYWKVACKLEEKPSHKDKSSNVL